MGYIEIPVIRRFRESRNLEKSWRWILTNAGMTGFSSFPMMILLELRLMRS
ncbi:hypothetical protein Hneap_0243 [Halothiobacillus neapolitanus c2]|jgi:hypothetical protein|uniref:Uncharacterized protein n=1 Tax=Halothiobacillus neapolitanus (strain ATCC 23641 / DSM 15147 / CIP 104769 / NCIMB 8539 / c2) TaxID=555778 RepID=D0KX92_HALNC|nr:hypothetical protein Hneap_0243 [Halothiobacillus neapolitanus c2]TDN60940.1 hypothetical protein C8D83_10371 [Halothiobacillus neapolitanus]